MSRLLAQLERRGRTARGLRAFVDLGDRCVQDQRSSNVVATHIGMAEWALEHGALGPREVCGD